MKTKAITQPWHTSDITLMSNITSVHVQGKQVTKLGEATGGNLEDRAEIHLELDVKDDHNIANILTETKTIGLILNPQDALGLGLMLTAMGIEHYDQPAMTKLFSQLSKMKEKFSIKKLPIVSDTGLQANHEPA